MQLFLLREKVLEAKEKKKAQVLNKEDLVQIVTNYRKEDKVQLNHT